MLLAIQLIVYIGLNFGCLLISTPLFLWVGGYLAGVTCAQLFAAVAANWLTLRIYENARLEELGLLWNRASRSNLLWGLIGGAGSASLVLLPPLMVGAAHLAPLPAEPLSVGTILFVTFSLAVGAAGEELLFRGYGFQRLLVVLGPFATILPVGVVFALLHEANPDASRFGIANTAGFGVLFGYAYLRSRDLWLPIGLHFGWNVTFPLFGVKLSGLSIRVTGHQMLWTAGSLWSGGEYGPEASLLTTFVLALLFAYVWKVPIRRQPSRITDEPAETPQPAPPTPLPSR